MAVKIGWTQNAWTFGEPNYRGIFINPLEVMGEWRHKRDAEASLKQWIVINVPLKPKFLTSIQAVWWFLSNMHAFLQVFVLIITHPDSLYFIYTSSGKLGVLQSQWSAVLFQIHEVELRTLGTDQFRGGGGKTWKNHPHLCLCFFFPLGGWGWRWVSFHVVFFFGSLVGSWGVLVLMMWSC